MVWQLVQATPDSGWVLPAHSSIFFGVAVVWHARQAWLASLASKALLPRNTWSGFFSVGFSACSELDP